MKNKFFWVLASLCYAGILTCIGNPTLSDDALQYFTYANNFMQTGVYGLVSGVPDMTREPGYSFFLTVILELKSLSNLIDPLRLIVFVQSFLLFWMAWCLGFKTFFKKSEGRFYFFICILSPTLAGTATVLFSESFAAILMGSFFASLWAFTHSKSVGLGKFIPLLFSALCLGFFVLTKSYFQFATIFLILFAFFVMKKNKRFAVGLIVCALTGLVFQQVWVHRNKNVMGSNYSQIRMIDLLAGKILRVETFQFPTDLPKAFTAAIGENFCAHTYGQGACAPFGIQGADWFGFKADKEYLEKYPDSINSAESHLLKDLLVRYWHHPFLQLLGSGFETIRMAFFESTQRSVRSWINFLGSAWHFGGSLLFLGFFCVGLKRAFYGGQEFQNENIFMALGILILFYHWATMCQLTNVVRFIYPLLPIIYIFVAKGMDSLFRRVHGRVLSSE